MWDNPEEGELDPAVDDRRRFTKNSPFVLSCIDMSIEEVYDRGSTVGTFHNGRGREGPSTHQSPFTSHW